MASNSRIAELEEAHQLGRHLEGGVADCPFCLEDDARRSKDGVEGLAEELVAAKNMAESAEEEADSLRQELVEVRAKLKVSHAFNALLQETLLRILQLTDPQRNRN